MDTSTSGYELGSDAIKAVYGSGSPWYYPWAWAWA